MAQVKGTDKMKELERQYNYAFPLLDQLDLAIDGRNRPQHTRLEKLEAFIRQHGAQNVEIQLNRTQWYPSKRQKLSHYDKIGQIKGGQFIWAVVRKN
jgi:hypothetical protein